MKLKTCYTVTFEATFEVPDGATPREIADEISKLLPDLPIPEDSISKYVEDSFKPDTLENGDPEVYPVLPDEELDS